MIEKPAAKFKFGQKVFFLEYTSQQYGVSHQCTACGGMHYSERHSKIIGSGEVTEMTWQEVYSNGGQNTALTWRYEISSTRGAVQYRVISGIQEAEVYATHEEAEAARVREMEEEKKKASGA